MTNLQPEVVAAGITSTTIAEKQFWLVEFESIRSQETQVIFYSFGTHIPLKKIKVPREYNKVVSGTKGTSTRIPAKVCDADDVSVSFLICRRKGKAENIRKRNNRDTGMASRPSMNSSQEGRVKRFDSGSFVNFNEKGSSQGYLSMRWEPERLVSNSGRLWQRP